VTGTHGRKGVCQHAYRNRKDQRCAKALQSAEGDDERRRRRQRTKRGGQAEQRDARQEGTSAPEDVADAAGGHHECAQREHVNADDPLQVGCCAVQIECHPRQREIHGEVVDLHAEQRH